MYASYEDEADDYNVGADEEAENCGWDCIGR